MKKISFTYYDEFCRNGKWSTQICCVNSLEECKRLYGLDKCKHKILSVVDLATQKEDTIKNIDRFYIDTGCIVLEPEEVYDCAIETVIGGKRVVYDYNRLVKSLADSYRKEETDEDPDNDFEMQAIEWIDYNTMRSLPYFTEEFRPFIAYISEEELKDFLSDLYGEFDKIFIDTLLVDDSFLLELTQLRQDAGDEFEEELKKLLKKWRNRCVDTQ